MRALYVLNIVVFWIALLGIVLAFSHWVTPLLVEGEPWTALFDFVASFGISYAMQVFFAPYWRHRR